MPKRPAPSSPSATAPKKAKAAPKAKTAAAEKSTLATVAETVKKGAKKAAAEIAAVVENAGALLTDDVAPEDSKATKTKKGKAPANAAPLPPRGTKRKTAEEFMDKAVASVADKVGGALSGVVREFGEASGLIEKATTVEKKAKSVTKKAEKPAVEKKAAAPKPKAASKGKKAAVPEPEAEAESEAEGSEASFIGAFESDDDEGANSSDDDSDDEDAAIKAAGQQIDMSKLPKAKDDKSVAARLKKAAKKKVGYGGIGRSSQSRAFSAVPSSSAASRTASTRSR
jgi:nucleolar protein 15